MFEKLQYILTTKDISVNKLARMSDITASDLYCALNGKKPLYPNWRKRIAVALDLPESELFEGVE